MRHELWVEGNGGQTFCLAGPLGDDARRLLSRDAKLAWTVEASSHFEAMTLYYGQMAGASTPPTPRDRQAAVRGPGRE